MIELLAELHAFILKFCHLVKSSFKSFFIKLFLLNKFCLKLIVFRTSLILLLLLLVNLLLIFDNALNFTLQRHIFFSH